MKWIVLAGVVLAASSCGGQAVRKVPVAYGGSKGDANIVLGYDEGAYETASVDWATGEANALKRCQAWGYSRVESFAGGRRECVESGRGIFNGVPVGSCARYRHYRTFQCVD